jgi:hypothetical protein
MISKLNHINGSLYFTAIIILASLKSFFGYYISSSNIYSLTILDNIYLFITAILLITLTYYRAKRFLQWKQYFFSYLFCSLIHQLAVFNNTNVISLESSDFYTYVKLATLGSWVVMLLLTFNDSNIQKTID